jgi:hypothetical protein
LAVTNTGTITIGTTLQFSSPAFDDAPSVSTISSPLQLDSSSHTAPRLQGLHCQILTGDDDFSTSLPIDQCVVPPGINGPIAVFITPNEEPLNGVLIDRQFQQVIAGPDIIFIDAIPDPLGSLIRNTTATLST